MLDLATFLGLTRDLTAGVPVALYFHENQLTYPLPPGRARDLAFPWINYTGALAADTIFFNSAFHRRAFLEALRTRQEQIRFVQVRHEEAAAFAACGYAKYTGRLGVCVATSGPGGIHLLNGLYDAKCDGAPVLAITGHTFHDLIGTSYQQDVDLDKLYIDVAAYNQRVMGPAHMVNVVGEAVKTALGRGTVAHITIPKDIQDWTDSDSKRSAANVPKHSVDLFAVTHPLPPQQSLQRAADLINAGSKVAILAGRGALGCRDELIMLSGNLATMANGLPYSIGAAVAYPGRQVVAIVGDGGFTMLMGEVATLVKYKLPVKIILVKNGVRRAGRRLFGRKRGVARGRWRAACC